jgi:hypothetical protein
MTDGLEIRDARHVTDDERSNHDRHEHPNIYSTKEEITKKKDHEAPGKGGLILPLHYRIHGLRRDMGIKRDTCSVLVLPLLLSCISMVFLPFTSLPLLLFSLYSPGHEEKETVLLWPSYEDT